MHVSLDLKKNVTAHFEVEWTVDDACLEINELIIKKPGHPACHIHRDTTQLKAARRAESYHIVSMLAKAAGLSCLVLSLALDQDRVASMRMAVSFRHRIAT